MGKDRRTTKGGGAVLASVGGSVGLAAALLLGGAGIGKLRAPQPAAAMLRRGLPKPFRVLARTDLVRLAGAAELAVAAAVVLAGNRLTLVLLAAAYVAFFALSARLVAGKAAGSCGCFGRVDSPVGAGHLVLNLVAAGAAVAEAVRPPGPWGGLADGATLPAVIGIGQAALLAGLGYLTITALPALNAERRRATA